jgi:hypothetical protein
VTIPRGRGMVVPLCVVLLASACGATSPSPTPTAPSATLPVEPPPAPAPTAYSLSGIVREAGGGPLVGVTVRSPSGPRTTTDASGAFSISDVRQTTTGGMLIFDKPGFRAASWDMPGSFRTNPEALVIRMQPVFFLSANSPVASTISSDDLSYSGLLENSFWDSSYNCSPCKEIRVAPILQGARLHLHWSGSTPLDIWAGEYYGGVNATAAGGSGESDIVLDVRGPLDNVLVGVGLRSGAPQEVSTTIRFTLTVEP